ncbi:MAG: tyrosine-protein phosphatase [Bacillota bacterium]
MTMNVNIKNEIKFEKLYNFRDIGGLQTEDGRRVKSGVLFRSDDISRITKNDLAMLQEFGLKLICDLRTVNERKFKMYQIPENWGTVVKHIPIYHGSQDLSHRAFFNLLVGKSKDINFEDMIKEFYHCMVNERKAEIREVISSVANDQHVPALIHCTGGKDRTGLIAALIQLFLGFSYETVIDQYLRSNALVEPRMKKAERFIRIMSLYRISPERIKPLLIVNKAYLENVLQDMFKQYGSVESYLMNGCGIEERTLHQLKDMLIE